jgi:PDZ domain-containing secreted protein
VAIGLNCDGIVLGAGVGEIEREGDRGRVGGVAQSDREQEKQDE